MTNNIEVCINDISFNSEIWKEVYLKDTLTSYSVSNMGNVKNRIRNRLLKPNLNTKGYPIVSLHGSSCTVHRLVAIAFIPNPDGLETVDHGDEDKLNNKVSNLSWMTRKNNSIKSSAKRITLLNPEGFLVEVHNLSELSRSQGWTNCGGISVVCNDPSKSYKGWKHPDYLSYIKQTTLIDPDGELHTFSNLLSFCKELKLSYPRFCRLMTGKTKKGNVDGWSVAEVN